MNADRFLNGREVRDGFARTIGTEYYKQFRPWLQSIANAPNTDIRALAGWDKILHQARINATMVGVGFRLTTMMKHGLTALSNSMGELGPKWILAGSREFFGSPEKMERASTFVFERSADMRHRMDAIDRDTRDALNDLMGDASWRADVQRFGHYGVAKLDQLSAMPTWLGAFRKATAEGLSEADASYAADKAVRTAHGSQGIRTRQPSSVARKRSSS